MGFDLGALKAADLVRIPIAAASPVRMRLIRLPNPENDFFMSFITTADLLVSSPFTLVPARPARPLCLSPSSSLGEDGVLGIDCDLER